MMSTRADSGSEPETGATHHAPDLPDDGVTEPADTTSELQRIQAERDEAVHRLERLEARKRKGGMTRRVVVGVLVVLFAILTPVTVVATWAHRTVLNTDNYIATVGPIASDPAVTAAVSRQVTDQLYASLDPQAIIAQALPPKAAFLAGPIANGAKGQVQSAVNRVLSGPRFHQLWISANRFAHSQLVAVLRGKTNVLQTTKGQVVLNLVPLLNNALENAQAFVSGVVGKQVQLPTITGDELPSAACAKIAAAINRPVPPTCGQIALFPSAKLESAQRLTRAFDRGVIALLIVTPLLAAGALWVSRRKRRTLMQLTLGGMLTLVLVRRVLFWQQNDLVNAAKPENKAARSAIVDGVLHGLFTITAWMLVCGLVIVAVAWVTGPYRWAVSARRGAATVAGLIGSAFGGAPEARDRGALVWIRRYNDALMIAAAGIALLLLLFVNVNIWWSIVILGLLALAEYALYRLRQPDDEAAPPEPPGTPQQRTA